MLSYEGCCIALQNVRFGHALLVWPIPPSYFLHRATRRFVETPLDETCWHASHDRIGLDISGHNRTSGDNSTIADYRAIHDGHATADPDVVADADTALFPLTAGAWNTQHLSLYGVGRRSRRIMVAATEKYGLVRYRAKRADG